MKRQKEILKDSEAPKSLKTSSQGIRGVKKRHCKHFVKFYSFLDAEEKQEESKKNAMTMMLSEKVTTLWKKDNSGKGDETESRGNMCGHIPEFITQELHRNCRDFGVGVPFRRFSPRTFFMLCRSVCRDSRSYSFYVHRH